MKGSTVVASWTMTYEARNFQPCRAGARRGRVPGMLPSPPRMMMTNPRIEYSRPMSGYTACIVVEHHSGSALPCAVPSPEGQEHAHDGRARRSRVPDPYFAPWREWPCQHARPEEKSAKMPAIVTSLAMAHDDGPCGAGDKVGLRRARNL